METFNARDLASRVAGLVQGQFKGDLVAAARYLDADPEELRGIVEEQTSHPSLELLAAIVKRFGVDACWLITGEYDWRTHARALEDDDGDERTRPRELLLHLVERGKPGAGRELRRRSAG